MLLVLNPVILIPIIAYRWAKRRRPEFVFTITGVAIGFIAFAFNFGLYAFYWYGPTSIGTFGMYLALTLGMSGLILVIFHGFPAGLVVETFELRSNLFLESHVSESIIIFGLVNGLFWAVIYGLIGFAIDQFLKKRRLKSVKT